MMKTYKAVTAAILAVALVACGGGGGSAGTNPNAPAATTTTTTTTTTDTTTPTVPPVATLLYELSKPALSNGGGDTVLLTMTAVDANNNPMAGVPVTVSVDSGIYTPDSSTTSATGQASGKISIGGSTPAAKTNRNITATMKMRDKTATAVVAVTGTQITITPIPATLAPAQSGRIDLRVVDSNGTGIAGVPVALGGTLGYTGTVTTDLTGAVSAPLASAPAVGTYTVTATALGVSQTRSVQVVDGAGGGIPNAVGPITSASLSIVPTTINPNQTGSTTNKAALRAKFLDAASQPIKNVRVRFEIVAPAIGGGEQISTGTATVYSEDNGEAIADYIPGTRSSPTDGVTIRACYGLTDAAIAGGACGTSETKTLTVAGQPLSITLGDNNILERGNNNITYIKKFDVAVADAAGNAVAGAVISASVDVTHFYKGPTYDGAKTECPNEDLNRNGSIDTLAVAPFTEDTNGNGRLEPRKADAILSFLAGNTTAASGRMAIQVEYPQNVATWLKYTVKVTTSVGGSEGTTSRSFVTTFIEDDDEKGGSFLVPPYGQAVSCAANDF